MSFHWGRGLVLVASFGLASAAASQGVPAQDGQWSPLLEWGIQGKHMVLLSTGDVLVWSTGENARVWDPETGTFTLVPATFGDLHCAGHVTLADGRVIVLGGVNGDTHIGTTVTAIFDAATQRWTQGRPMNFARWYASVTALPDGRVLVTSGDDGTGERVLTPEIYDPVTNTWVVLTGAVRDQSLYPLMYVLPDGRVYESGPKTATSFLNLNGTGSWTSGPANAYSTSGYSESSVMYAPGKILRAGGDDPAIARASVIDMTSATPQWRDTGSLNFARRRLNLVILADGQCLAVGGTQASDSEAGAVLDCEIWNPNTGVWTVVEALSEARMYHSSAILLPDGRVVSAGGEAAGRQRAQIYSPPYLFKGARPVITSAPASVAYGRTFDVVTPSASSITSVALLRPSAATHAWDQNQRYVPLSFVPTGSGLSVTAPPAAGSAPPGYYMLVIKNGAGVPSVARFVRVGQAGDLVPGSIRGKVTVATTLVPVAGATVAISAGSTTTAGDGTYVLDPVASGEQLVTFTAPGFAAVSRSVEVQGGATTVLDVSLSAPGTVQGRVTDLATNLALAGAAVFHDGGSTTTDANGIYTLTGVPAGGRAFTASSTTYVSLQQTTTVVANGSVTLDFKLTRMATFISGGVFDVATSQPLVGASVSYGGGATTTDALGRYRFDGVAPGTQRLTVSAAGYLGQSADVVVVAGAATFRDFGLAAVAGNTRIKDITFEGGSLTDAQTGADARIGAVQLETQSPLHGSFSARINAGSAYVDESFAATDDLFLVFTLSLAAWPAADARILRIGNSQTTVGNVVLRNNGRLRLKVGTASIGVESLALTPGVSYRVGVHQRRGTGLNGLLEAFVSPGTAAFGAPFAVIASGTWTSAANRLQLGTTTAEPVNLSFDDLLLDSAAMPGGTGSGPPSSQKFGPVADARVSQATPGTNLGAETTLQVRNKAGSSAQSFLRFDLGALSGSVVSAKLRLFCTEASDRGGRLYALANSGWTETGITWSNKPALPSSVGLPVGVPAANSWVEVDVTSLVTGPGILVFALGGGSSDSVSYGSRESATPPELVIQRSGP